MRRKRGSRGQSAVEFTVMSVLMLLAMFLVIQLAWVGVQKWQFNHFTAYAARVWQVQKDDSPTESLLKVLAISAIFRWQIIDKEYVKFMWVSDEDATEDDVSGIEYQGVAPPWSFYRPYIGTPLGSLIGIDIPGGLGVPNVPLFVFETFIPVEKEPEEDADRWDNDCEETPCESGNGR